jgi:hypothetical protein
MPGIVHDRTRRGGFEPWLLLGWEQTDLRMSAKDENILNYFTGNARRSRWQYTVNLHCKVESFRVASIGKKYIPLLS